MLCEDEKIMHFTEKQYTTDHNTKQYTTDHNTKQYTTDNNTKQYTTDHNAKWYTTDNNTKQYTTDHNTKEYTTDNNTKQYTTDHKTKHTQYTVFPEMPMVAQLIKIFPWILWSLGSLQSSWECHSMLSQSMNSQNATWYSSLKSTAILSSHIHTHHLNGLFPSHFPITNLLKITFTPMHATFLTHYATALWYPTIWQAV